MTLQLLTFITNGVIDMQLGFDFKLDHTNTWDNYFPGPNLQCKQTLQQLLDSDEQFIFISGVPATGKTHLLQACCHAAYEQKKSAFYVPLEVPDIRPSVLDNVTHTQLVCLDNLDAVVGDAVWEPALFHCYNQCRDQGVKLVVVANTIPSLLGVQLPDLQSRLTWGLSFQLKPLSDEEKIQCLMMRAEQRGLELEPEVAKYLLTHFSRDLKALLASLEALDKAALSKQHRLTIPFVKSVLA